MPHPPLYTLPWSEVCAMGERRELIVSAEGYLLSSKDRKFDPKYAKYIWSANVDNAVHRGLLRPEDNPKGTAAPPNIKPKEAHHEQCLEETETERSEISRVEVAASPEKAETCSTETPQVKLVNAKGKPFTWSYTALSNFEGCPARYAAEKFYCTAPFVESEAIIYGNRVHTAAEQALKGQKITEPQLLAPILPYLKAFIAQRKAGASVTAELELALNENMQPVSWFAKDAWFRAKLDVVVETPGKLGYYDWKGLALDTPIPTPRGFVAMQDLKEGDDVFGIDGNAYKIVGKSDVHNRPCYKVVFDDHSEIVCDDQHLWAVDYGADGARKVMGVEAIREACKQKDAQQSSGRKQKYSCRIPLAKPVEYMPADLPIDPYVLGVWIGDGKHTSGEICKEDTGVFTCVEECGYDVGPFCGHNNGRTQSATIYGLVTKLRTLGVLGNKHIPAIYLKGSVHQRLSLLQGLMDTDGSWNKVRKQCVFVTVNEKLADDVMQLLWGLGQRPQKFRLNKRGFGKDVVCFDIVFSPVDIKPFRTKVKADRCNGYVAPTVARRRMVMSVVEVESVPTQCISVDAPDNIYLCGTQMIPTHNTGGKVKDDQDQLKICCAALSLVKPEVETYTPKLIWTKHSTVTGIEGGSLSKAAVRDVWEQTLGRVERMQQAWAAENFPARPSGLCPWCSSYDTCKYARRR